MSDSLHQLWIEWCATKGESTTSSIAADIRRHEEFMGFVRITRPEMLEGHIAMPPPRFTNPPAPLAPPHRPGDSQRQLANVRRDHKIETRTGGASRSLQLGHQRR